MSLQGEFASIARELGRGALVTVIRGENLGARMLVRVDGSTEGSLGSDDLDRVGASQADELMWAERSEAVPVGETLLFVDVVFPAPRLVIFGAIVVVLSDGWDRGDPEVLAEEMARLRRCAHRVLWLNPLAADPRYEPLTRGMRAALPHVDHLLAGNSIASLEELADLMDGGLE